MKATTTKKGPRAASVVGELRRVAQNNIARLEGQRFPMVRYQGNPVGFVCDLIGEEPLAHQAEILLALAGDPAARVAVRSGQKQGKTKLVVWAALWFYACFPGARVFMTASTAPQVNRVLWKELRLTAANALRNKRTDFGEVPLNAERGVEALDGRSIQGFTTRTIEAMAGLSGANMLFIGDEASSFENDMAEAIQGNTAGAARIIWISNPTRAEGPFYDCFFSKRRFWTVYHLNSEDLAGKVAKGLAPRVPGIATPEVIARWKEEYGVDSPFYLVRVRGDFVLDEQARCVSLHNILAAQTRYPDVGEEGPLSIGIDPAGDKGEGDRYTFAVVRGAKLLAMYAFRGLSEEAAIAQALGLLREFRRGDETPNVVIDAEGPIGSAFYGRMRAISIHTEIHAPGETFGCYGLKGSHWARREPQLYEMIRDELWVSVSRWIKTGAIPPDRELEEELYAPGYLITNKGKRKVTHKDVLRGKLGRSPDKADALCLATWSPSPWVPGEAAPELPQENVNVGPGADIDNAGHEKLGPYGRGGFSPY